MPLPSMHTSPYIPCDRADEAKVEDEADGHDGAVEREEDGLPPAHPPQPRREVRQGALHVPSSPGHDDDEGAKV